MTCKHLLLGVIFLIATQATFAQKREVFDQNSYLVSWSDGVSTKDKDAYLKRLNSRIICEYTFGGTSYAWMEFMSFPFDVGGETIININSGVTPTQTQPEIDNFYFDYITDLSSDSALELIECYNTFDLVAPTGLHPVTLYNLDTGTSMPICDNSASDYDFCGLADCSIDYTTQVDDCIDLNGHGTHGLGIQRNVINTSISLHEGINVITIKNYTVFDAKGKGNLGSILCALYDVLQEPVERKVVNCSFSFYKEWNPKIKDPLYDAFVDLSKANILSVTSAGNDGIDLDGPLKSYPACYFSSQLESQTKHANSTICVGASSCDRGPAIYSNYSSTNVDISTLGNMIGPDQGSGLVQFTGTSQATFASSAIAAILMSNQLTVNLESLKCSMISSAEYDPNYSDINAANGVFSASLAFEKLVSAKNCGPIDKKTKTISTNAHLESKTEIHALVIPNPVNDRFIYSVDVEKGEHIISLFTIDGQMLSTNTKTLESGTNLIQMDLNLKSGIYIMNITGNNLTQNTRFIKL